MSRAYYINGLRTMLMARYGSMERMGHPDRHDQGRMIDLNKRFLEIIREALNEAEPSPTPEQTERK